MIDGYHGVFSMMRYLVETYHKKFYNSFSNHTSFSSSFSNQEELHFIENIIL